MAEDATLDDILADASPVERVVPICVAGALVAEFEMLEQELIRSERENAGRLGNGRPAEIARQMDELRERMRAKTYNFRFRALPAKQWSDLLAKHPDKPKPGQQQRICNMETFVPAAIAACCVSPAGMNDPEKAAALFEKLNDGQQEELFSAAWEVNSKAPKEPTSFAASAILRASETNSSSATDTDSLEVSS